MAVWGTGVLEVRPSFQVQASSALSEDELHVTATVKPVVEDQIRAWFFLADPDEREPWRRNVYRSAVQEEVVTPQDGATFEWRLPAGSVPAGRYAVTIWFHYLDGEEWKHLDGGSYGMAPIDFR
ncbi:MAG: hypothetical protein EPO16_12015 [Dehalococcoidia bacterium]|nr:MAG: hypothetical protein EPO16_12015 [Dehalococcoidia bacterium]